MMQNSDPLAQLRDIHLPPPVSAWPPAPGWWLLALLIVVLIAAVIGWYLRRRRCVALRKQALSELQQLQPLLDQGQAGQYLQLLNQLLKRVALATDDHTHVVQLHGEAWLAYLNQRMPDRPFDSDCGRLLVNGPYQQQVDTAPCRSLHVLAKRWIQKQRPA